MSEKSLTKNIEYNRKVNNQVLLILNCWMNVIKIPRLNVSGFVVLRR